MNVTVVDPMMVRKAHYSIPYARVRRKVNALAV